MRSVIICAFCVLATPAAAQRIDVTTINGVRVWSPAPPELVPSGPPDPQTTASTATTEPGNLQIINGIRIWGPRPSGPEPFLEPPPPPVSITINLVNAAPAYGEGLWPGDYDGDFWSPGYWPVLGTTYGPGRFRYARRGIQRAHGFIRPPVSGFRGFGFRR
jgi:hypothetical protein